MMKMGWVLAAAAVAVIAIVCSFHDYKQRFASEHRSAVEKFSRGCAESGFTPEQCQFLMGYVVYESRI